MTEPTRWLDDDGTPDEIRELLSAGHRPPAPDREARMAATAFATQLATGKAAAAASVSLAAKLVIGLATATAVTTAIVVAIPRDAPDSHDSPAAEHATEPRGTPPATEPRGTPPATEPPEPAPTPAELAEPSPPAQTPSTRRLAPSPAPSPEAAPPDALTVEASMLERARAVLGSDPTAALALTEEHRRAFSDGQLAAERELIAVDALLRLGRRGDAERRAASLIARAPEGMYARRLQRMLDAPNDDR